MKRIFLILSPVIFLSCNSAVSDEELKQINGYWEIEMAVMPDGTEKEYTVNPTIDFFELKGKKGFRKKVMPQFDGSYRMNDLSEKLNVVDQDDKTYIVYTTEYAKWKEEIVELSDDELVLRNEQDMEYHYKKPKSFTVK